MMGRHRAHMKSWVVCALLALVLGCGDSEGVQDIRTATESELTAAELEVRTADNLSTLDVLDRSAELSALMRRLDSSNLAGAQVAFEEAMPGVDEQDVALFANAYARIDPVEAIRYFRTWSSASHQERAIDAAVLRWLLSGGVREAFGLAESYVEGTNEESANDRGRLVVRAVAKGLAVVGAYDELNSLLLSHADGDERGKLALQVVRHLGRRGENLYAWLDSLSWSAEQGELKASMMRVVLSVLSRTNAPLSAPLYEEYEANRPEQAFELLESMAVVWARQDPDGAVAWVLERPEGAPRAAALRSMAYDWLQRDPEVASQWIEGRLEDPVISDAMLFPLTQWAISVDLQKALALSQGLERPNQKSRALKQILILWGRDDFDAVDRYLSENELPEEVERAVRGQLEIRLERRTRESGEQG